MQGFESKYTRSCVQVCTSVLVCVCAVVRTYLGSTVGAAALVTQLWAFSQARRMHVTSIPAPHPAVSSGAGSQVGNRSLCVLGWKGKVSWGWFLEVQLLGVGG